MSEQNETVEQQPTFEDRINALVGRIETTYKDLKSMTSELKSLKKEHAKIVKKASGGKRTKKARDPNAPKKAPSGFAKPTRITKELADFLGLQEGDLIARPKAIKQISNYVKEHKLQDDKDGRIIRLDREGGEVLANLLQVSRDTELTYFNLQTYMKIHFPKATPTEAAAATASTGAAATETVKPRRRRGRKTVEVA